MKENRIIQVFFGNAVVQPIPAQFGNVECRAILLLVKSKKYIGSPPYADLGLEKNMLLEICVSGTVGSPILRQKTPTCAYISQKQR